MISVVKKYLNGFEPLQRKIWLYCFDATPSAQALHFVMNWINEKRFTNPDQLTDDEITAWRYYPFRPNVRPCTTFYELVIECEIRIARHPETDQQKRFDYYAKMQVQFKNARLNAKETEHGTPSCICIRNHFEKIHSITDEGTHFLNLW